MILARSADFGIEAAEVVHGARMECLRGEVLQVHHDDVVDLEGVRQRHDRSVLGLQRDGVVVEHVVADVFDAGFGQVVEGVEGLREARAEPAARALAGELLDHRHGLGDDGALVVELVHGDLLVGVRVELPAALQAGLHHLRVGLADPGVDGDGRLGADALVHLAHAPEGDAHAVLVPAPVRQVGKLRRALRRGDHRARHRPRQVPVLQRQHRPHHQPDAFGQAQRRALSEAA